MRQRPAMAKTLWTILGICLLGGGCANPELCNAAKHSSLARELDKVSLPAYVIEPPDILLIDAVRAVPMPPYKIEPLDQLLIRVPGAPAPGTIEGVYGVEPEGTVNLGIDYGKVRVVGMSMDEAKKAVEDHLQKVGLKAPQAEVSLAQTQGMQQISGEHLVRPDGTISLGSYGPVYVTGLTIEEARKAIEQHLAKYLLKPIISIDILAYNSKVYYVIADTGGFGIQVVRLPVTGNETVLDAVSQIQGLPPGTSNKRVWVARPAPANACGEQILPVDWCAVSMGGQTATNYQLFPGDRVYVAADPWIAFDNYVAKITTPFERMFGFTLLGNATVRALQNANGGLGNGTGAGLGAGF